MRTHWAEMQNAALEKSGAIDRVDHRSLEAQREEAEQERDKLQDRVTDLESVIDGYALQLVEPDNLKRWDGMRSIDVNREWDDIEDAERERKKLEAQLQIQTIRAAELDRAPQIKLGPAASAMERKARQRARELGTEYQPTTERGEIVQAAQEQSTFTSEARERFDAARTAYSEARELGFSRTRSAYEAAREALLFGVELAVEQPEIRRDVLQNERNSVRESARIGSRQREREGQQSRQPERAPPRQASVWDALDEIGREQVTPQDQSISSEAMTRIQERTAEQKQERETEEAERQKLEREKQEREQGRDIGLGYGF